MNRLLSAIGLTSSLLVVSATASAQNLVVNGSFEQTTLSASGVLSDSDLPGWQIDYVGTLNPANPYKYAALYFSSAEAMGMGATGTDHNGNWVMYQTTDSPNGGKFVAIDGDPAFTAVLSQSIAGLTIGHTYNLSFQFAGAQENDKSGATTEAWQVSLGNQTQTSSVLQNASHGFTGWFNQTMSFTASSTTELLSFLAVGTPAGLPPVSLLDGVSLTDAAAPVPEPSTWALMLAGVVGMGFALRRRRS